MHLNTSNLFSFKYSNSNLYRLTFSKPNNIVILEFKLLKKGEYDKPTIYFNLKINGKTNKFLVLQ